MTTAQKERPILFSGPMVRAILDGRKTQTRRVVKPQPEGFWGEPNKCICGGILQCIVHDDNAQNVGKVRDHYIRCPYGAPGERLWVRETWGAVSRTDEPAPLRECGIEYRADLSPDCDDLPGGWPRSEREDDECPRWRPSIHMPRWASRITLEVVSVRVERVQEIGHEDALAEGCAGYGWVERTPFIEGPHTNDGQLPVEEFEQLWDSINAKRGFGWDANPWVWVVEFRRVP